MKLILIVFAISLFEVNAFSANGEWLAFKETHNKFYKNLVEEKLRFTVFQSNLNKIEEHNARYEKGQVSYYLGVNKFADMTSEEFKKMFLLQLPNKPNIQGIFTEFSGDEVPDSVDWREKGAVLGVKDQGSCGSCWAFSTTGALEGQNFLVNNLSLPLSEQELMDCSLLYDNQGCNGGLMNSAFDYVRAKGLSSEDSYPYEAKSNFICKRDPSKIVVKIKTYKIVAKEEEALKNAVATIGPISVAIYANEALQLYKGGIFDDKECINYEGVLNHGVLAVGYGDEDGKYFWLVKNSWGEGWGESGYFKLQRNPSLCGILLQSSYPLLQ